MSQCPVDLVGSDASRDAYDKAWAALNKLLRQGKSESGNERNCCFLNLGAGSERFATVSATTSLDYPDDARGQALCDWDHDGRVDFWVTNRTAPRVRLLMNRYETGENKWISLRLHGNGTTVNRDAIGARIEVYLPNQKTPLLRTVTAGTGFVSQSSAWIPVGLGKAESVEKILVKWPGGEPETFAGTSLNGFFDLTQGQGKAVAWKNPDAKLNLEIKPAPAPPAETEAVRMVLINPIPLPQTLLSIPAGTKGRILNLWSATCPNCQAELKEWGPKISGWTKNGLAVASWCVDADLAVAERTAKEQNYPGAVLASEKPEVLSILNAVQLSALGMQKDMPVPSTFLIDANNCVTVIYKGPVKPSQLEADFELLTSTKIERLAQACPLATGQWKFPLNGTGIRTLVGVLLEEKMRPVAERMLEAAILFHNAPLPATATADEKDWQRQEFAAAQSLLALWDMERKAFSKAEQRYLLSLQALPSTMTRRQLASLYFSLNNPKLYPNLAALLEETTKVDPLPAELAKLGVLKIELGKPAEAIEPLQASLALAPDATNFFQLGQAYKQTQKTKESVEAWNQALKLKPEMVPALNNLAWLHATSKDTAFLAPKLALDLAEKAVSVTKRQHHIVLATLAAAQAANQEFDKAVATCAEANARAVASKDKAWAKKLDDWSTQFQKQQPLRE